MEVEMSRALPFTQARIRRAVKGAKSAGMQVRRITVSPNGAITMDSVDGGQGTVDNQEAALATSWDDV
jgi:hypothetical protein